MAQMQPNTGFGESNPDAPMQALGDATLQQLASVGGTAQGAVGNDSQAIIKALMAKAAEKALTNNLNDHAQQLLATHPDGAAILAAHIDNPSLTANPHLDKMSVLKDLLANSPDSLSFSGQPGTGQDGADASSPEITDIQKQVQKIITPEHRTLLGNILNGIGNITGINAMAAISEQGAKSMKLANLGTAQTMLGQQPIQPLEAQKMDRETLKNAVEATTAQLTNSQAAYKNIVDSMKEEKNYRNILESASGSPNQTYKSKRTELELQHQNYLQTHENLKVLLDAQQKQLNSNKKSNANQDRIVAQVGKYGLVGR